MRGCAASEQLEEENEMVRNRQYGCMLACMRVMVGFVSLNDDDNYESVERAFSQVVLQLRHLVNVWRTVLPAHIYARALGINS